MPITPTYPGVYIEEVPSEVHTITGVATSIAAFLGRTSKGPINKAIRILSLSDYVRVFGEPHPKSDLAHSVRLFFTNGGTDCYVIRLAKEAAPAEVTLRSLQDTNVLVATAKAEGLWGNTVRLEVDYNTPNPDETFNLRIIQEEGGEVVLTETFTNLSMNPDSPRFAPLFVTQSSELIDLTLHSDLEDPGDSGSFINNIINSFAGYSQARRPLDADGTVQETLNGLINPEADVIPKSKFEISINDAPFVGVDLRPWTIPADAELISSDIQSRINDALGMVTPTYTVTCEIEAASIGSLLKITPADAASGGNRSSVRVRRASSNDISAALMLGVDQGGIEPVRWSNFRPAPNGAFLQLGAVDTIASLEQQAITAIVIEAESPVTLDLVTTSNTAPWFRSEPAAGSPHGDNDGVREKLRRMARAINNEAGLPWRAEVWGYHLAILAKEGNINTLPASITTGEAAFDDGLRLNVRQYSLGTAGTGAFSDGNDGSDGDPPEMTEYIGNAEEQTGFHALDSVDLFNLMVIPADEEVDETTLDTVLGPASTYCAEHRALLLIDAPASWSKKNRPEVVQNTSLIDDLRAKVVKKNSAVFYPRLKYSANGLHKFIGPSGAIAGLMARIDSTRGVWKAPAGTEADIRGILGLEVKLTDRENGVLNKLAVNCLREFPGSFVNWGARSLDGYDNNSSDEWKYISVRRVALFIEESLYRGTKWVVFEPNDEPLWAKIRLNIGAFMMRLFRQGAFQGSTPDKAFFVKCDAETTTQADRNLGIVNIVVGFAPLKPAEFVIIKIQQIAGEL